VKRGEAHGEHAAGAILRDLLEACQRNLGDAIDECFEDTGDERRGDITDTRMCFDQEKNRSVHVRPDL